MICLTQYYADTKNTRSCMGKKLQLLKSDAPDAYKCVGYYIGDGNEFPPTGYVNVQGSRNCWMSRWLRDDIRSS